MAELHLQRDFAACSQRPLPRLCGFFRVGHHCFLEKGISHL